MNFGEIVRLLYPFCSEGINKGEFVVRLLSNVIQDDADENCKVLNLGSEYLGRIFAGTKSLPADSAAFITSHLDKRKFKNYFRETLTDGAAKQIAERLAMFGISSTGTIPNVSTVCADALVASLVEITMNSGKNNSDFSAITESINRLNKCLSELPKPTMLTPPEKIEAEEQSYVDELLAAYGDADGVVPYSLDELTQFADYFADLVERRIDYFSAESIHRGVSELRGKELSGQFDILKEEIYSGVRSIALRKYANGFEKMISVMDQAVQCRVDQYLLSHSPYWISNRIKMGVCHFLVNEGKMKWVKRNV